MFEQAIDNYLHRNSFDKIELKAALFDMDGVLFDSMPYHAKSWSKVCQEFGLNMSPNEAYMHEGRTGASTINLLTKRQWNRLATQKEIVDIYAEKCRIFNQYPPAEKMPGAKALLNSVKSDGVELFVVTGSGQESLLSRLETGYPGLFVRSNVVSSHDVKHGKPNPEPYLLGLEKAHSLPWQAIVVENAPLGVKSAVDAHIFTIAVNTGPLDPQILSNEGANLVFPSMEALHEAWSELFKAFQQTIK